MSRPTVTKSPSILTARWVLPVSAAPIQNGYVAIENGKIKTVGRLADLPADCAYPEPEEASILTPGLVNCHTHLEQSFAEPIRKLQGEPFTEWLCKVVQTLRASSSAGEKIARCQTGAQELLESGTTCVNDIASGQESLLALDAKGLRGVVSLEVFHPGSDPIQIEHWLAAYRNLQEGYMDHVRLRIGLSPHSAYNVSPVAWQAMVEACQPWLIHSHLAEFEDETRYLQGQNSCIKDLHQRILGQRFSPAYHAPSPVAYLHGRQLLSAQTVLAHAIHTTAADRECLQAAGVGIAHCPRSNLALHGQTLRAADWQCYDIPLGLGTDGRLSTSDLDLRAEARCAMQQHGWSAVRALGAMTINGARVLAMANDIGSLEPGKWADMVLWKAQPFTDLPEDALLRPSTQAQQVLVAGQNRYKRGCHAAC